MGGVEFNGELTEDQTLEIIDKVTGKPASIQLSAGMTSIDYHADKHGTGW